MYFSDEKYFSSAVNLKHSHSEMIFEIADGLFKLAAIQPADLVAIAVSEGPGSFTGLRIGFSAAKGMAYGARLPIIPVPTYEALAFQLTRVLKENDEFIISNKVNKDEVFFSKFQIKGNNYIFVEELTILTKEYFIQKSKGYKVFGNSSVLNGEQINYPLVPNPLFLAKWAIEFGMGKQTFNFDFLEPNYLKDFIAKEKK
ncbi:MAG: tRNA (adenosine(37)-N6)-threonylcarbamoyltransferase complex dimerization subunit type 1 TsaB [Ignavibacteriaceae bacterium]|nr:tRNA (adenosine(37)-N6)-threonylcarbamoyltransferase complex dimerization subunit type 1 TsaB [Ignavibacteriaceae bacterium]